MVRRAARDTRRVIDTVKASLVAHVATLYGPPLGEIHGGSDATWFITGDPDPHRNGILEASLVGDDPRREINRLLQPFRSRRQPMMWWFFTSPDGLDHSIHQALVAQGLYLESDRPSMTLDLSDQQQPDERPDLQVRRVDNQRDFDAWVQVVADAFDSPDDHSSLSTRGFRMHGFGEEAPFRHYISVEDGTVVGAATLSAAGGVAGLGNIATRRSFQRRGIAFATVRSVLRDAVGRGLRTAALSADPAGTALYLKLGFQITGKHLTYIWAP
jgi:GNAT superfamily N-acetyltransferase